jgi:hypothetical protein
VLAYNETTKQDGEYAITQTHKNLDEETTYLTLENPETKKLEYVETTPNHPFYLEKNVDGSARGKAAGHADLSSDWVGAGDLKQGDVVKRSSGNVGVVASVQSVTRQQEMYNLTVEEAHTFFVGDGGWLVHNNQCDLFPYSGPGGGHHIHQKAAFEGNPNYDLNKALALPNSQIDANGWNHQAMTREQRRLQDELARSGRPNTMVEQTRIAVEALVAGGATKDEARKMVAESLNNLRNAGARSPTGIPWNR